MADAASISGTTTRFENAFASGGTAIRGAIQATRSGAVDVVLVGGVEKLTTLGTEGATEPLAMAADTLLESQIGVIFPDAYALIARAYFEEYGGTRENLAAISVKNHANAIGNEYAQFCHEITVEDVHNAPAIANPLGLYDSCPVTDSAAALLLVSEDFANARNFSRFISITRSGQGSDSLTLQ